MADTVFFLNQCSRELLYDTRANMYYTFLKSMTSLPVLINLKEVEHQKEGHTCLIKQTN